MKIYVPRRARLILGVATVIAAALVVVPAAAAAASPPETHGAPLPGNPAISRPTPASVTQPTIQEMVARVSGVSGTVLSFTGTPVVGADVGAGYVDAGVWRFSSWVSTDGSGAYSLADVPATTSGFVETWYQENGEWRDLWVSPLTFPDASTATVDMRPGRVSWQAYRAGYWDTWRYPSVRLENTDDSGAITEYTFDDAGTESGQAEAVPGSVEWASINFWWDEADEWFAAAPVAVVAGGPAASTITFDEDDAVRCWVNSPYWGSCRPGQTVKLAMHNWPAGNQVGFWGWGDSPNGRTTQFGGKTWTSPGRSARLVSLKIPSTAKAGYGYILSPQRIDDPVSALVLKEYVQLATLNKAAVTGGVRLSGVVPTRGHWGSTAGIRKVVNIYAKSKRSSVPTKWDPSGQGWRKVASVRCNGYGVYKATVHPQKDTWYVARYARDAWYWGAFTNVVSVNR